MGSTTDNFGVEYGEAQQSDGKWTDVKDTASSYETERATGSPANEISIDEPPKLFYLLTQPRSASNLLVQILNLTEQQHVVTGGHEGGYYFKPLFRTVGFDAWEKHVDTWAPEEQKKIRTVAQECYTNLAQEIAKVDSEPGKTSIFVKEHCKFLWSPLEHLKSPDLSSSSPAKDTRGPSSDCIHMKPEPRFFGGGTKSAGNETLLSDDFLLKWMPTFLVRHPALAFPSHFRAGKDLGWSAHAQPEDDEQMALWFSLNSSRKLYDFFDMRLPEKAKQYGGVDWPVVLTGDVVITEPRTIKRYASLIRLKAENLRFQWEPRPKEEVEMMEKSDARMLSTLTASAGIDKSKASEAVDIDVEVVKWQQEFGDHAAKKLEEWVRAAMPDYEFFEARRLRADPTVIDGRRV